MDENRESETSTIRDIPSEVLLGHEDRVTKEDAVHTDRLQTVAGGKIGPVITSLTDIKMKDFRRALLFALGYRA